MNLKPLFITYLIMKAPRMELRLLPLEVSLGSWWRVWGANLVWFGFLSCPALQDGFSGIGLVGLFGLDSSGLSWGALGGILRGSWELILVVSWVDLGGSGGILRGRGSGWCFFRRLSAGGLQFFQWAVRAGLRALLIVRGLSFHVPSPLLSIIELSSQYVAFTYICVYTLYKKSWLCVQVRYWVKTCQSFAMEGPGQGSPMPAGQKLPSPVQACARIGKRI